MLDKKEIQEKINHLEEVINDQYRYAFQCEEYHQFGKADSLFKSAELNEKDLAELKKLLSECE